MQLHVKWCWPHKYVAVLQTNVIHISNKYMPMMNVVQDMCMCNYKNSNYFQHDFVVDVVENVSLIDCKLRVLKDLPFKYIWLNVTYVWKNCQSSICDWIQYY